MPKLLSFVFLMCFFTNLHAQVSKTDSLIGILQHAQEDTNKVHLYWKTGASIIYQDPQKAIPYFKQGTILATRLGFVAGMEKCLNATSLAFSVNAKYDSALIYINYAIPHAIKAGNIRRLALAYLNRADVYTNLNDFPAALKDCDMAILYAEKAKNNDALGRIYSIMNSIYSGLKQYPEAFAAIDKSDRYFNLSGSRQMVAMNYSERGELLVKLGEPAKALHYFKDAIAIADSLEDVENLAAYYNGISEVYFNLKNYAEATSAANMSLQYAKQTGNTRQEAGIYESLSNIESAKNNFPKAIEYGIKAFTMLREEKDLEREMLSATSLADVFSKAGDNKHAFYYLKISRKLNDSLVKQQFTIETANLQTIFAVKQKDKEIELLNKDKELQQQKLQKQRLLMLGVLLLIVLGLTGAWLLFNRNKLRSRMKELELRNQIAADLHDEVGSSLSSINILSQMVSDKSEAGSPHKSMLAKMSSNARETVDKMSDIVWMIKPGENEGESLKQRMERFLYEMGSAADLQTSLEAEGLELVKLSMHQRKNIYLVFKEAVNNAVKYSATEKIYVSVNIENGNLNLIVKDEGTGFDIEKTKNGNGLGNMKNRAKEIDGSLVLTSEINSGTTVQLNVHL